MTAPLPIVSDHAVLRYLERARGFDIEAVRLHIATLCAPAMAAGALHLTVEGVKFAFSQDRTIVTTVLPAQRMPSKIAQARMAQRAKRAGE